MTRTAFYLAGRFTRRAELAGYAADLRARGHTVTARWLTEALPGVTDDGTTLAGNAGMLALCARRDLEDVRACDVCLVFTEPPGAGTVRGGAEWESGYAWGRGKVLVLVGPPTHLFHHLPAVTRYPDWEAFLAANGGPLAVPFTVLPDSARTRTW